VSRAERPEVGSIDIERWRDRSAFQRVYVQEWRDLCAFLRARFGAGPPDPEDIAQQAFLKLGERPADQPLESPRAFVFRIAINLTLDGRRHEQRLDRSAATSAEDIGLSEEPGPERALIAKDDLRLLERVVAGMPDRHRQYLAANRIEGQSFAEIARRHGVSESLVRKAIDEAAAVCQRALARGTIDYRGLSRERSRRS